MFLKSASEIWKDLDERFGYASMTHVYSLEQQLAELVQGTKYVSDFFTAIKPLWDSIDEVDPLPFCTCNNCTCNLTKRIFDRHQAYAIHDEAE